MFEKFSTVLIGGDNAKRAAFKIGEFDYLCKIPFSVKAFVNPSAQERFQLINCGWDWHDVPVFQDIKSAVNSKQPIDAAVIYLNAKYVYKWTTELLEYNQIKNIVVLAEDVPERDAREIIDYASTKKVNVVGPSSTGILVAGKGRLGEIGGDWRNLNLCDLNKPGSVGLITKSGGMSGELLWQISQAADGVSTAVQIGGDAFPATDFVYWLEKFSKDPQTKVVVMAGEAGGDLEERAAAWYKQYVHGSSFMVHSRPTKNTMNNEHLTMNQPFKLIAVISGKFLEQMPKGQKFGHAGAKQEESGFGSAKHKIEALVNAGAEVVELEDLGKTLSELTTN